MEKTTNFIGMTVLMYRNLNNGKIALRSLDNKVIGYCDNIHLINCTVKTSAKTAARIRNTLATTGKHDRSVHAFIVGTVVNHDASPLSIYHSSLGRKVSYNPYKSDSFYHCDDMSLFTACNEVKAFAAPKGQSMLTFAFN